MSAELVRRAELAALRKKKTPEFEPSGAHTIFGHGEETPEDYFIVPPTSTVVTIAYPGEAMFYSTIIPMIQKLACMKLEDIRNPLANPEFVKELVNLTGGVVIYKPGDLCPNFKYILLQYYPAAVPIGVNISKVNGIVELNEKSCKVFEQLGLGNKDIVFTKYNEVLSEAQAPLFQYSLYPTPEIYQREVAEKQRASFTPYTIENITIGNPILNCLEIDQKTITQRFPGVTYNFICRYVHKQSSKLFSSGKGRQQYTTLPPTLKGTNKNIQALLKQRIANAELRKKLMKGTFLNNAEVAPDIQQVRLKKLLWLGVEYRNPRDIQAAIEGGVDIEAKEEEFTPLEALIAYDTENQREIEEIAECLKILLRAGAVVSDKVIEDSIKHIKIIEIDGENTFPVLEALGERGVFQKPGIVFTIMENCKQNYTKGLLPMLVRYGCNLLDVDENGNTWFMENINYLYKSTLSGKDLQNDFLATAPTLRTQNKNGNTIAHQAALKYNDYLLALLLEKDPELLQIPNAAGLTPFLLTVDLYRRVATTDLIGRTLLRFLELEGADPDVQAVLPDGTSVLSILQSKRAKLSKEIKERVKELYLEQGGNPANFPLEGGGHRKKLKTRRRLGGRSPSRKRTRRR